MKLFDATLTTLEHSLDVRLERQSVLAGNIANADTPDFMPMDVDFDAAMQQAEQRDAQPGPIALDEAHAGLRSPSARGAGDGPPLVAAEGARPGIDGNAVDLDRTMVSMAQNAILYGGAAKAAGKKLAILRYVASDGAA